MTSSQRPLNDETHRGSPDEPEPAATVPGALLSALLLAAAIALVGIGRGWW